MAFSVKEQQHQLLKQIQITELLLQVQRGWGWRGSKDVILDLKDCKEWLQNWT